MPMITVKYDDTVVSYEKIMELSSAAQKIVAEVTGIKDVFVYGLSPAVKVEIAPIEIFVEMSDNKVVDLDELTSKIKEKLVGWKTETNFDIKLNLTVIPMHWKVEVGI